jgi:dTDP-D-glucose 4,6-dehydratase
VFNTYQPDKFMQLAVESVVDRSIDAPSVFIQSKYYGYLFYIRSGKRLLE